MMNFNKIFKYALFGAASLIVMPAMVSCDDDDNSDADPVIRYVRPTEATSSDSLLTAAALGQCIAIIGENLDNVYSISFNDKPAIINLAYVTSQAIVINVPSDIPDVITDTMYVTARNGNVIKYPFVSTIPAPVVNKVSCEYVKENDIIELEGNFFVATENDPVELTFAGNVKGEYLANESSYTKAVFKVPAGVQPGLISVKTVYGVTNPSAGTAYINDNRSECLLMDFDKFYFGGWGKTTLVETEEFGKSAWLHSDEVDLWSWDENTTILFSLLGEGQPAFNSPVSKPEFGLLKFEMKVDKPWTAVALYLEFQTPDQNTNNSFGTNPGYCYEPWKSGPVQTDGWVTVSIPLSNFCQNTDGSGNSAGVFDPSKINGLNAFVRGGTGAEGVTTAVDIYVDNFRIVPTN